MSDSALRTLLPAKATKNDSGIWSVLKNCVGKDLSKVTMPIQFNEPISFLQRVSEHMEYAELLNKVNDAKDPAERLQYVAAFAVSALASNFNRLGKPFNPVIGETYELQRNDYKMMCEQVSHHPPISAFHAESSNYVFHGWIYPKLKLWGKSVEIHPKGKLKIYLKKFKESYSWKNINCTVHGVIVGKLWIEHHGTMEITCPESGLSLNLHFKPSGWFNKELHTVDGFVVDSTKKTKLLYVYGKWTETVRSCDMNSYEEYMKANAHKFRLGTDSSGDPLKKSPISPIPGKKMFAKFNSLSLGKSFSTSVDTNSTQEGDLSPNEDEPPKSDGEIVDIPNSVTLWEVNPRPDVSSDFYHFTTFTMSLNQVLPEEIRSKLCPTDSRLRPDIRKMEEGDLDKASEEKLQLEERQRKYLKNNESDYKPLWFDKSGDDWDFNGKYWQTTHKSHIANLF